MSKSVATLLKLLFVVGLMWWVFRGIHFEDRICLWKGPGAALVLEQEQVVEIVGPWKDDPIRYRSAGSESERSVRRGLQEGGLTLTVEPGFFTYWHNLDGLLFALGALCYFLTVLIAGARWWWLLRVNGTDVSLRETLRFTWIGVFFNSVVPGATGGDLIKALYIMKRCPGHRVQVLVSVIVDRVLGLASLALLGALVVLLDIGSFRAVAIGIWSVILGVGLLGVVAFSRRLRQALLGPLLSRLPHGLSHRLKLVDQAVFFYRDHKSTILASLLAGIPNHLVSVLSVVLMGKALDIGVPTFDYFVLIPVINIVSAIPIGPNGWGVGETLYHNLFGTYCAKYLVGVANAADAMGTRGVALSVLYRLHLTLWSLLGGLFVFFEKDRVTRADIETEVALEEKDDVEGGS
ncbi:MAG: flippase-like domain-containing protein [Planctomycetes bacterium]|nr:flippase-like domain-containing protein [Planctomycetota bacterium]